MTCLLAFISGIAIGIALYAVYSGYRLKREGNKLADKTKSLKSAIEHQPKEKT